MVHHMDGRTLPHDADNTARIYTDKRGLLWVTHQELVDCGYRGLEDFDVVYLNGKFFELQAHISEANAWWIEEIPVEETTAEQTSEAPQGEQT